LGLRCLTVRVSDRTVRHLISTGYLSLESSGATPGSSQYRVPLSLETPIGEEGDSQLGDLIEDKNAILPIDAAIQSNLRDTTTRVLASLLAVESVVTIELW
jgi:hypothetical protein